MALSLDEYVCSYLEKRSLTWPGPPPVEPLRAKPHLARLPVRAVLWNVYGTLLVLGVFGWLFIHPMELVTETALDKTIQEFKMWNSMSRKPGPPGAQMRDLYNRSLTAIRMLPADREKHPETRSDLVWSDIVKKLQKKDYKYDITNFGSMEDFTLKTAYFYHANIQGFAAYPGAADALRMVRDAGLAQGLLADGQLFTPAQLTLALNRQDRQNDPRTLFNADLRILSAEVKARKPSDTIFQAAMTAIKTRKLSPADVLHVGSSLIRDIGPAKKLGMRTALFAGDKASVAATAEQLKDPQFRPDVMLTELNQIVEVVG